MPSLPQHPLARLGLACLVLVALVYVVVRPGGDSPERDDVSADGSGDPESVFGPVPTGGSGVIVTDSGLALPVTGRADDGFQVLTPCARTTTVDGERVPGAHVVLDPGHGGRETGAIGPSGVVESELNLDVARRVAERLRDAGAVVVLTRDADVRVAISTRAEIAEAAAPLAFISIHHNSGPTGDAARPGVQVYHQHEAPGAARLGSLIWAFLQRELEPFSDTWSAGNAIGVRARLGTDGDDFYGVLRRPTAPSVLVEALYLSSEPETTLLTRDDVRAAEADAIAEAVVTWLESDDSGGGQIPTLVADESAGDGGGTGNCEDPPELAGS